MVKEERLYGGISSFVIRFGGFLSDTSARALVKGVMKAGSFCNIEVAEFLAEVKVFGQAEEFVSALCFSCKGGYRVISDFNSFNIEVDIFVGVGCSEEPPAKVCSALGSVIDGEKSFNLLRFEEERN